MISLQPVTGGHPVDGSALMWGILICLAVVWIGGGAISGYGAWRRARRTKRLQVLIRDIARGWCSDSEPCSKCVSRAVVALDRAMGPVVSQGRAS